MGFFCRAQSFRNKLLHHGHSMVCWRISTVHLCGLQGTACPTTDFTTFCRQLCSVSWSTSSTFTALVTAELLLSHYPYSSLCLQLHSCFSPLLKSVIPELLPLSLMGSTLASGRSFLELAGIDSGNGGSFLAASHRSHPGSPSLPKPCCSNPNKIKQKKIECSM